MDNIKDTIIKNEGMIYKIINKYKNYFELDDLYQVAVIGLIKAYKNYNTKHNAKFTTYAYPYILGEVIKYINEYKSIKVNKNSAILYSRILKTKELLTQKLMKEPSTYEIALFMEMDESSINEIIISNSTIESLDRIISEDNQNFNMYDKLGYYSDKLDNYALMDGLNTLTKEELQIIKARYYEDMSQKEVGDILGMYQVEVSRKEKNILRKLRNNIAPR